MKKQSKITVRSVAIMVGLVCLFVCAATPFFAYADVVYQLSNPLKVNSLQCLLFLIVNGLMVIVGVVAGLYIIFSGFMFVAARGNPEKLSDARRSFFNAIIGTAILLGAWAITALVVNVVNSVSQKPVITSLPTGANCQ